jgi:hypothetical protein
MRPNDRPVRARRPFSALVAGASLAAALLSGDAAQASGATIAVGEVTPPPPGLGIDATVLRSVATDEIRHIDASRLPRRRRVVVSLALTKAAVEKKISMAVNATLRDADTGAMIAIIESGAQADGPGSVELRKEVANAAVRSAVRRIPRALGAK